MLEDNFDKIVEWYFANSGKGNSFLRVILDKVVVGYWDEKDGDLDPVIVLGWDRNSLKTQTWHGPRNPDDEGRFLDEFLEQVLKRIGLGDLIIVLSEGMLVA